MKLEKPLVWIGSSKRDLVAFPSDVKDVFGYALHQAQHGEKHPDAKPLKGFGGAKTLEVVDDYQRGTYRAVYTVKFEGYVYVPALLSEEIEERHCNAKARYGQDPCKAKRCRIAASGINEVIHA